MSMALIKKDIDNNNIVPVYLFYGEDRYTLVESLKILKKVFLEEDPSGSCIEYYPGKDTAPDTIYFSANTPSFFSRRLIIVDDIPYFKPVKNQASENDDDADEEGQDSAEMAEAIDTTILQEYCRNPNPAACLVLISTKVNRGRKLYKEIVKVGKVVEFSYPKGQAEWVMWIQREIQIRGKNISSGSAAFLADWAGHHTGVLAQEIDKLILYIGDRKEISKEDIIYVCVPVVETTIFAMLDSIAAGNAHDALKKLSEVMGQEYYLRVHAMIVRQIRLLLAASLVQKRGEKVENLINYIKISPYEAKKVFRQAYNFSFANLALALEECLKTDLALKRSGDPHLLLEMMVINFCKKIINRQ